MTKIDKRGKNKLVNNPTLTKTKFKSADKVSEFAENIINTVREPLIVLDQDLRVIKASHSFYDFFKVTSKETIGTLIYDLGNQQWNIPKLRELLETILPEETTFNDYEVEHNFTTIGKRVMLLNARQIKRAFGKEKIILLAIENITERKHAEESISENNRVTSEYLDILLNHAFAPIIIWDPSLVITHINNAFEKLSGYSLRDLINKKIAILFPQNQIASTLELIKNTLLSDERPELIEIDILTKDKGLKTVLWNPANIYDKEGKYIVATIAQDITDRKHSDESLRMSEEKYRNLIDNMTEGIFISDEKGTILFANNALARIHGFESHDQLLNKNFMEFVEPSARKEVLKNFKNEIQLGKSGHEVEIPIVTADGSIAYILIKPAVIRDEQQITSISGIVRNITERKKAEQKVRESEKRFRTIFDQAPIAIALLDKQGHPVISNLPLSKMTGYSSAELSKMKFTDFTFPEDIDKDMNQFSDLIDGKISMYSMEKRYIHKNGNIVWANLFVTMLRDENGMPGEIIGMVEDITERKRTEEKLRGSEERFRHSFDYAAAGICIVGTNGKFQRVNKAFREMIGYSEDELKNLTFTDITFPDDLSIGLSQFGRMLDGEIDSISFEKRYIRKDKRIIWTYVSTSLVRDVNQKSQFFITQIIDITDRKLAEEKLQESEGKYRSFFENSMDSILLTSPDGRIFSANPAACKTFGYSEEELIKLGKSGIVNMNDPQLSLLLAERALKGKARGELTFIRKDGTHFPSDISSAIFKDQEGLARASMIIRDITERKRVEKELIEAKEKAEQSDKLKTEFLAQMSHEIRTPLNAIVGNTDYLNDVFREKLDTDTRDCFASINLASERMIRTVDLILNAAELQTSGYKPHNVKVDLNSDILYKLYLEYQLSAKQKGLKFSYTCKEKETKLILDEYSVTQIFANLIDNAVKYTKNGKIEMLLEKNNTGNLIVEVKDTGIGISKEFLPKMFDPFVQEEQGYTRSYEGNGLGLTLVKKYCELNNATIEVESEKNAGSTFRIIFNKKITEA
ncbi:MAG: PAS domain S-box protein [Ignavibacteriaceae bacterium]|jgi:PAS domain S-box-containing protein